ncbi:transposable element Tcb1 transposase [Trichonephila clavipes]|nr:transposable element Tcb1 transposase [Trichonephila clavipes]
MKSAEVVAGPWTLLMLRAAAGDIVLRDVPSRHCYNSAKISIWEDYVSRKQRSAFDQVSEFDRERTVAYRVCGLSFRKIGSRVGRNQNTVMRIYHRWMQEGTTGRRGRSHPLQCTTSREDRQIVHMAVTDHSVILRTVTQHIKSVTHH